MIITENLTKKFAENIAVNRLTLEVKKGEVFGFLGPNGAGKTTTVRLLTCLISPTSGNAYVNGLNIKTQAHQIRQNVGILTETPGLYENLSAARNLEIFAQLYEVKDVKGQIERYLRMLGIWDQREDPAATFSKGMKQKLALARALIHEPKIVFLDEPTSALDPEAAHLVREFITELRQEGRTIFLCTHNLDEADRLCNRIALFKSQLLTTDTPANLRETLFGRKVVVHLREVTPNLVQSLQTMAEIKNIKIVDNKLVITLDNPEKTNPIVIRTLVNLGADIQFVGELRHSLEDVYMQLMNQHSST
ncbi:MAG: ABC transporter ATP-binding protein [Anaerolineales bacterium]|nr:ABC transporter ATP-binding protein [Anaerolineales bacterium]